VIDVTGASVSGQIPHDLGQIVLSSTFGLLPVGYLYVFLHALFKTASFENKGKSAHEFAVCVGSFESSYSNV